VYICTGDYRDVLCLLVVQAVFITLFRRELGVVVFLLHRFAKILKYMHI